MARILSVNTGAPTLLPGSRAPTGIIKTGRAGPVALAATGVDGDAVLDRKHHGGADQAVYIYLVTDYDYWAGELDTPVAPGLFGENLTLSQLRGDELAVGDRLAVGDVLLELTSHRTPCATFARRMGDPLWVKRFHEARRPGAYARVLSPGTVAAGMAVDYHPFPGTRVTMAELMGLDGLRAVPDATMRRVLQTPIHHKTRRQFEKRLAAGGR